MSKYRIKFTNQFKKDLDKAIKQRRKLEPLFKVIDILSNGETLDPIYKDHALKGKYEGKRECHVENDFLLVYVIEKGQLKLLLYRVGTHSELF